MKTIKNRHIPYKASLALLVLSVVVLLFVPKNLGIDMTGGIQITYSGLNTLNEQTVIWVKKIFANFDNSRNVLLDETVYLIENNSSVRLEVGVSPDVDVGVSEQVSRDLRQHLSTWLSDLNETSFVKIWNSLWTYVRSTAIFTLTVSLILIALYLTYAFRGSLSGWSNLTFWLITLITLMHDVLIATGIYVILWLVIPVLELDTFFVTALLTILGYSINDTIVVLDRIRSSLSKNAKKKDAKSRVFEDAIQSSIRRSLFTSATLLIVLVVLVLFGPIQLIGFVTLLILGTIVGTYSSLFIAAPLVYDIQNKLTPKK